MKKKVRKGNHDLKCSSPFDYQPKSRAIATFFSSPRTKQKQKKKKENLSKYEYQRKGKKIHFSTIPLS